MTETTTTTTTDILATLAAKISDEATALDTAIRASLVHARNIGLHLIEVKAQLPKTFTAWVKANCPFSPSTAGNYLAIARQWDTFDPETLAEFTLTGFLDAIRRSPRKKATAKKKDVAKVVVSAEPVPGVATNPTTEMPTGLQFVEPAEQPTVKSRQGYPTEYVHRMAAQYGIVSGDVFGFLQRFGVRVEGVQVEVAEGQAVAA